MVKGFCIDLFMHFLIGNYLMESKVAKFYYEKEMSKWFGRVYNNHAIHGIILHNIIILHLSMF